MSFVCPGQIAMTTNNSPAKSINPFNSHLSDDFNPCSPHLAPFLFSLTNILGRRVVDFNHFLPAPPVPGTVSGNAIFFPDELMIEPIPCIMYLIRFERSVYTDACFQKLKQNQTRINEREPHSNKIWLTFRVNVETPNALERYILSHMYSFFTRLNSENFRSKREEMEQNIEEVRISNFISKEAGLILSKFDPQIDIDTYRRDILKLCSKQFPINFKPPLPQPHFIESHLFVNYSPTKKIPQQFKIIAVNSNSIRNLNAVIPDDDFEFDQTDEEKDFFASPAMKKRNSSSTSPAREIPQSQSRTVTSSTPAKGENKSKSEAIAKRAASPPVMIEVSKKSSAPAKKSATKKTISVDDVEDATDQDAVYQVQSILGHRTVQGELQYLIKWKGYNKQSDNTWEPHASLIETLEVEIQNYLKKKAPKLVSKYF